MTQPPLPVRLLDMPNLGPKSQAMLLRAGISTPAALREAGAVQAYLAVKHVDGTASLNLLWALEGALTGRRWLDLARQERASLLLAVDETERASRKESGAAGV